MKFSAPGALPLALSLLLATPAHAQLSPTEQRMVAHVEGDQARSVALLERLVNQNSGSLNFAGVEAVGAVMRAELEAIGFRVRWVDLRAAGRAGHLIAVTPAATTPPPSAEGADGPPPRRSRGGPKGKRLLLIGHLDTVFEPNSPFQRFSREGDRAIGPGVDDDKGGMVVMLMALRAMHAAGALKDAAIEVHLTGDEESVGAPLSIARRDLIAAGKRADVALDFEGLAQQDGRDMGSIARRSSANWTLSVTARGGHSSGIFSERAGDGAVYAIAKIIAAFRAELPEPNLTFNVGLLAGGAQAALDAGLSNATASGKTNIIPEAAVARGDMRTLSDEQSDRVRARMQAIVARPSLGATATLTFAENAYPAMAPTAGARALLARLNAVNSDLGLPEMGELDPLRRGAGDIAFVAKDVDGLVGLGSAGDGAHAPGESVDLLSFQRQAKRAAILMSRLSRESRQ